MSISQDTIESLLHEGEGNALDFKRDQYPFDGASDTEKSELLKDILAMANSWRRTDAYILIGVEEVQGGRALVVGVTSHLDDGNLQQFVHSKTQRPLEFAYHAVSFENKQIGVIHVPIQERPLFLKKNYGKLKEAVVYVRRGSSTDSALPDDVARMGAAHVATAKAEPNLKVEFYDTSAHAPAGNRARLVTKNLRMPPTEDIPDHGAAGRFAFVSGDNVDYYRQAAFYLQETHKHGKVTLCVQNAGDVTAVDVRLEISVKDADHTLYLTSEEDLPEEPSPSRLVAAAPRFPRTAEARVMRVPNGWRVEQSIGKVQPKATVRSTDGLYIGAPSACQVKADVRITADDLAHPVNAELVIDIAPEVIDVSTETLLKAVKPKEWHE